MKPKTLNRENLKDWELQQWYRLKDYLPEEGTILETKISDEQGTRNEAELIYQSGLFFFKDMSMYVYYTPTHWRYV